MPVIRDPASTRRDVSSGPQARPPLGLAGVVVVCMFTVVALSGAVNDFRIASVSYTAIIAAFTGLISFTLVLLYNRVPRPAASAAVAFVTFVAWCLAGVVLNGATRQGLQFITVQVSFVCALLLASTARRVIGESFDRTIAGAMRFTTVALIVSEVYGATFTSFNVGGRVSAIVALIGLGWFLAEYRVGARSSIWWALATTFGLAASLSRAALFAGFIIFVVTLFSAQDKHRLRNATLGVLLVLAGYWGVTSWAPLRDRFSEGDVSLSVAGININAEGRTEIWGVLWSDVQHEPVVGHGPGAGSARAFALSTAFDQPHNDFLRVLYDFGFVGLGLLVWFGVRTARLLRYIRKRAPDTVPALAALNAGAAVLIVMVTDNPLDYPVVMIPLGALIGLGLGSARR